jgi:hypothetical protein
MDKLIELGTASEETKGIQGAPVDGLHPSGDEG